jgi:hypothetical protein
MLEVTVFGATALANLEMDFLVGGNPTLNS